ncbi:MAG: ABC transporter substrate-binding protein [Proteobacteria bacterium]|nr:ABC transporter substrate-binding protein [Pseudomonadota bacterium]
MTDPRPYFTSFLSTVVLWLLILTCCLCQTQGALAENSKTVIDSSGQKIHIEKPFTKIISLYSAHTENLCSLGAEALLVGIGKGDDFPPAILGKPAFSYREDPEKFIATGPDLVLVRPMIERSYPEFINKLRQAGIAVISLQPNNIDEIFDYWRTLGTITGREKQAEAMITTFNTRLTEVQKRLQNIAPGQRPRVYFESIHSKMKTFAQDSIAIYVLEQAGGINLAADAEQVRETNIAAYGKERLLSHGGEIDIFLAQEGKMNPVNETIIRDEPGFQAIKAVREGKILLVAEALVSRPTLRILDGIEELNAAFYPQAKQKAAGN